MSAESIPNAGRKLRAHAPRDQDGMRASAVHGGGREKCRADAARERGTRKRKRRRRGCIKNKNKKKTVNLPRFSVEKPPHRERALRASDPAAARFLAQPLRLR